MLKPALHTLAIGTLVVVAGSLIATSAFALGGCVDSPENPTWLLAGIGGAAAGLPWLRAKLKRRRKK